MLSDSLITLSRRDIPSCCADLVVCSPEWSLIRLGGGQVVGRKAVEEEREHINKEVGRIIQADVKATSLVQK